MRFIINVSRYSKDITFAKNVSLWKVIYIYKPLKSWCASHVWKNFCLSINEEFFRQTCVMVWGLISMKSKAYMVWLIYRCDFFTLLQMWKRWRKPEASRWQFEGKKRRTCFWQSCKKPRYVWCSANTTAAKVNLGDNILMVSRLI